MLKFTPKVCQIMQEFLEDKQKVFNLVDCFGSPLNILFPENLDNNVIAFNEVFNEFKIKGRIFYAHKCNKSQAIIKRVIYNNIGIDVASVQELKNALGSGFVGKNIEATGPKNEDFIYLGVMQNITFNVDNLQELTDIIKFAKQINKKEKTKILLRINEFSSKEQKIVNRQSRFGMNLSSIYEAIEIIKDNEKYVNFLGFAFHLDTVNLSEKVIAIENCIALFEKCFENDLSPYVLDIGGGYKLNYLESQIEWNESISELKENVLSGKNNLTWNNASFGLRQEKGVLKGTLNIYNYYDNLVGADFLREILNSRLTKYQNRKIGDILSENMIELYIEPGKALLDNCGINIAKVTYKKQSINEDTLIGLDMKKSDLLIGEQEMFVDPIIITRNEKTCENQGVYFIGNLCMENDFIYKHKIFTDKIIEKDDLVVFINTAGYFMDFEQSHTIQQKIAKKIIITKKENSFKVVLDENYNPFFE